MVMNPHFLRLVERYPILAPCAPELERALQLTRTAFENGGKLLLCGNGGSAADCEHIASELMKSFLRPRPISHVHREQLSRGGEAGKAVADALQGALPCVTLTGHAALQFAISNDGRADMIFAQQLYGLGRCGDVLWGISTSGRSKNVVHAFHVARLLGVETVALTGENGSDLSTLSDCTVRVPASNVAEIQELHLPVYHALCTALEAHFFAD